jgi:hypothetical protein
VPLPRSAAPARVNVFMEKSAERRDPQRHSFLLRFLRRLAVLFLVLSAVLWAIPRVLVEFAIIGPDTLEHLQAAEQALAAAQSYGAGPDNPAFVAAQQHLGQARALHEKGQGREARREADRAKQEAVDAQRLALVRRSETRQRAEAVYNDLDREIVDLEKLYSSATTGLDKERTGQLLSLMKITRQSTALLFLAYEQEDYDKVLAGEPKARAVIASTRQTLKATKP